MTDCFSLQCNWCSWTQPNSPNGGRFQSVWQILREVCKKTDGVILSLAGESLKSCAEEMSVLDSCLLPGHPGSCDGLSALRCLTQREGTAVPNPRGMGWFPAKSPYSAASCWSWATIAAEVPPCNQNPGFSLLNSIWLYFNTTSSSNNLNSALP